MNNGAYWTPANMDAVDLLTPYLMMPRWVCWRYVHVKGRKKPLKVPIAVRGACRGRALGAVTKASPDGSRYYPDEWGTYQDAMRECARSKCHGIGIVLGGGLVGIDIDGRNEADAAVMRIVDVMESYTERSPSGKGLHILCVVNQCTLGQLEGFHNKNEDEGFEFYCHSRYLTFTGDVILEAPVEVRDDEVLAFCARYIPRHIDTTQGSKTAPAKRTARRRATWEPKPGNSDAEVLRFCSRYDGTRVGVLMAGQWQQASYDSQSEADLALTTRLLYWSGRDMVQADRLFRASGLMRPKWDERHGAVTYGQMTLDRASTSNYPRKAVREACRRDWLTSMERKMEANHG
jgi:putative DNA primase/helicase